MRIVVVALVASIAIACGATASNAFIARATDGGGYPYTAAACSDATQTYKGVEYCKGDNWAVKGSLWDYKYGGYGFRNCTDWVAYRLATNNGFTMPTGAGDASNWGKFFAARGDAPNKTPTVGAIAWEVGGDHVAYVESANTTSDTVTISEYNEGEYPPDPSFGGTGTYGSRTVAASKFEYIHVLKPTASSFTPIVTGVVTMKDVGGTKPGTVARLTVRMGMPEHYAASKVYQQCGPIPLGHPAMVPLDVSFTGISGGAQVPVFDFTAGLASNPQLAPYSVMVALAGASQCVKLADTSGLYSAEEGAWPGINNGTSVSSEGFLILQNYYTSPPSALRLFIVPEQGFAITKAVGFMRIDGELALKIPGGS